MSPAGSLRFLQRVWRVAHDVTSPLGTGVAGGDIALRRVTHHVMRDASELIEAHRFNVFVARVMELVNATRKAIDAGCGAADPAVREAAETVAIMLSLVAPYTAEEMWHELGHEPTVAKAGWPVAEPALLVEQSVTCVIQVQGKVRARIQVPPGIDETRLRELALAESAVRRAIDGRAVRTVIVRAPKLVNVVV
jgi:leucyl-tRNA synthetase